MFARWQRLPLTVRVAVVLWAALVVGVTVRVARSNPHAQTVVPIYRNAGLRWLAGEDLYAPAPPHDVYRNPPGVAAAFVPLAVLPEKTGAILWRLAGTALFAYGLLRFARDVLPPLSPGRAGLLWMAACPLALPSLNNGQVNLPLAGLILLGAAAAARERYGFAAAWLAAAVALKAYPVAAAALICLTAAPPLWGRFALAVAVGAAVPFVLQSPEYVVAQHSSFATAMTQDDRTFTVLDRVPRDWTILPRIWLGEVPSAAVTKAVSAAAGLAFAAAVLWAKRRGRPAVGIAVGLGMIWMTAFGPATENHTYTLLGPVAAAALVTGRPLAAGLAYFLLVAPIARAVFPSSDVWPVRTPQAAGALILMAILLRDAIRRAGSVSDRSQSETPVAHAPGSPVG